MDNFIALLSYKISSIADIQTDNHQAIATYGFAYQDPPGYWYPHYNKHFYCYRIHSRMNYQAKPCHLMKAKNNPTELNTE
jgi:hypothetical protein